MHKIAVMKASCAEDLKTAKVSHISQSSLTSDCMKIQFFGLSECENCECMHKTGPKKGQRMPKKCGGGETLKRLLAAKNG